MSQKKKVEGDSKSFCESRVNYSAEDIMTYKHYKNLPETMLRTEILDGVLVQEPAPLIKHQRVLTHLHINLFNYFTQYDPDGVVSVAPVDIKLSETVVLQPDLAFVSGHKQHMITENCIAGPPDIVIEIISPTSVRRDRIDKFNLYQRYSIQHYWLVDVVEELVEVYSLNSEGLYIRTGAAATGDLSIPGFADLTVKLDTMWEKCS
ncbi:Uma2 family endonuclease [Dethiobacter alkaliphilus]|uniref:Uma2 family endonuclease n=1 Tax=Dethiobacter alkaliphilus TaxID=427926 RepID=UPI0022277931|nr:Uma2 family endonuclease [Dethiobacter alkaliphilus]MCW3490673.1 Uma2 family endonuclease [Dethiobacter alkaliphilus]